ncbi:hypothetical protein VTO42DRAFT_516 [Malbranchea cinnamomea]
MSGTRGSFSQSKAGRKVPSLLRRLVHRHYSSLGFETNLPRNVIDWECAQRHPHGNDNSTSNRWIIIVEDLNSSFCLVSVPLQQPPCQTGRVPECQAKAIMGATKVQVPSSAEFSLPCDQGMFPRKGSRLFAWLSEVSSTSHKGASVARSLGCFRNTIT